MKCNNPGTWPEPSAEHACEDAGYGSVRVRAWAELHPKVQNHEGRGSRGPLPIVVGTLVLVEVERLPRGESRREPRVLWLWWHGPEGTTPDLDLIWRSYVRRFDLEHTFRFLKQSMGWTTPRVRHPEQADRWTWLVVAAFAQLRLARTYVEDLRLPWERRYYAGRLTPIRVHRAVSALLAHLGTRLPSRRNPAVGRLGGPKVGSPAGPSATLPSRGAPEPTKTVIGMGFTMGFISIAKPLVVKTQAKSLRQKVTVGVKVCPPSDSVFRSLGCVWPR
jgi:hypothetical protein